MTGYDYEYIVADYLRAKGYTGVKVTQASGDYGIDVLASKGGTKYAVQCKYYSNPVGIKAVQEAVAGKAHYGCNGAMVVTNNTFTEAAHTLAKDNGVLLIGNVTGAPIQTGEKLKKLGKALLILFLLFYSFLLYIYVQYVVKHPSTVTAKDIAGLVVMLLLLAVGITSSVLIKKNKKAIQQYFLQGKYKHRFLYFVQSKPKEDIIYKQTDTDTPVLDVSNITGLPHRFTIDGTAYDIDKVEDINNMPPVFKSFTVNGEKYYFNDFYRLCAKQYRKAGYTENAKALRKKANELELDILYGKEMKKHSRLFIKYPITK